LQSDTKSLYKHMSAQRRLIKRHNITFYNGVGGRTTGLSGQIGWKPALRQRCTVYEGGKVRKHLASHSVSLTSRPHFLNLCRLPSDLSMFQRFEAGLAYELFHCAYVKINVWLFSPGPLLYRIRNVFVIGPFRLAMFCDWSLTVACLCLALLSSVASPKFWEGPNILTSS